MGDAKGEVRFLLDVLLAALQGSEDGGGSVAIREEAPIARTMAERLCSI